jgi:hypothetical protein
MRKQERGAEPRRASGRPTKPPAPTKAAAAERNTTPPSYGGPAKGESPPERRGRPTRKPTKAEVEPEATRRPRRPRGEPDLPDQEPRRARRGGRGRGRSRAAAGRPSEQYIRLRMRVRGDRLSVLDSHLVDGPLAQTTTFPEGNAYEVTLGDQLLHAGYLPDLGIQRSFVNPSGPPEQRGHHFQEREVYEFNARVPAEHVTPETIGEIRVRLHRVKEEARRDVLRDLPLQQQFEREVRPVAELVGLPESALPEAIEERGGRTPSL